MEKDGNEYLITTIYCPPSGRLTILKIFLRRAEGDIEVPFDLVPKNIRREEEAEVVEEVEVDEEEEVEVVSE